jgi:hypothetical protein
MVIALAGVFLFLVYLFPLVVRGKGERDVFGPVFFLSVFGMMSVPYLWFIAWDRSYMAPELRITPWIRDLEGVSVAYVLLMAVSFVFTLLGVRSGAARALAARLPVQHASRMTPARCRVALVFAVVVGLAAYFWFLHSIGGLLNLWAHMWLRTRLASGAGYLLYLYTLLLTYAAALLVYRLRFGRTPARMAQAVVGIMGIAVVLASTGGRAPLISLMIICFLVHHYCVRRRTRLLTPGIAALGTVILAFFLAAPLFRTGGAFERYTQNPELLGQDATKSLSLLAPQFSPFDRTAVMLAYFTPDRMWMGRSYIDLAFAPVPRSVYPRKPPVDDGVYLKMIVDGHPVRPSTPLAEMLPTSWPMGNLVLYMNFGPAGLLVGMFLGGVVIGAAYHYMRRTGYALVSVVVYQLSVLGIFQLSVYGIVQSMMNLAIVGAFFWAFFAPKRWPRPGAAAAPAPAPATLAAG